MEICQTKIPSKEDLKQIADFKRIVKAYIKIEKLINKKRNNMKREVKFRGKAMNKLCNGADILHHKGDWLYGDLIHQDGEVYIAPVDIRYPDGTPAESFIVDADTVGQFTGLTDSKGVGIYEGDIVRVTQIRPRKEPRKERCIKEVTFNPWNGWNIGTRWDRYEQCSNDPIDMVVIIGNIHDNPELLTNK